jgi:putative ABC transport system ATP-binding protein
MIKINNLNKSFYLGDEIIRAIDNVSFNVKKGEYVAIVGPSGSGKSTLMNILGLLDVPDSGSYYLDGKDIGQASENDLAVIRNQKIGFIFQNFNLLGKMTALENIEVPLIYNGKSEQEAQKIARELLEKVGLAGRENHLPNQLSGGQQQRVAIARALSCNPEIILADEPTGALDSKTSIDIMNVLEKLNDNGQTIILITHDLNVAARAKRIVRIADGKLYEEDENDKIQKHSKRVNKKYHQQ